MEMAEQERKKKLTVRSVPTRRSSDLFPTRNRKFQNKSKKIQKIKIYHYGIISRQNRLEKAEKETKQKLSFHSVPTRRVIENSKKIAKKLKNFKNTIMASFQAKIGWKRMRKIENKNYHYVSFLPDA